jgi:hypothetical protein
MLLLETLRTCTSVDSEDDNIDTHLQSAVPVDWLPRPEVLSVNGAPERLEDVGEGQTDEAALRQGSDHVHTKGNSRDRATLSTLYYRWTKSLKQVLETARSGIKDCVERARKEAETVLRTLVDSGARASRALPLILSAANKSTCSNGTEVHGMQARQHAGNRTEGQEEKCTGKEEARPAANMRVNASVRVQGMFTHSTVIPGACNHGCIIMDSPHPCLFL